ncbi:hypothetical protein AMS68_003829 [Peltaster fructicola]|uniref:Mid2 domain-containing protein n=1 Tax=Peltaster fructicola TaxID=286661 RepID=A0A6H0XU74_9PEZI|nr:hypothetical protein AMS68_003829 [Peltaster fructicola]
MVFNGLCQAPGTTNYTTFFANGCTRPNGHIDLCVAYAKCIVGVTYCGGSNYCCYGLTGCNCSDSSETFSLQAGSIITSLSSSTSTTLISTSSSAGTPLSSSTSLSSSIAAPATTNTTAVAAGVGAGVGGCLLALSAVAVVLCLRRRNKAAKKRETYHSTVQDSNDHQYGLGKAELNNSEQRVELAGSEQKAELEAKEHTAELTGDEQLIELPASGPHVVESEKVADSNKPV